MADFRLWFAHCWCWGRSDGRTGEPVGRQGEPWAVRVGCNHYLVAIGVEAVSSEELGRVTYAECLLNPSFPNRNRRSDNPKNDFSITFWAWRVLDVEARAFLCGVDDPVAIRHFLNIKLPADTGDNYVDVT